MQLDKQQLRAQLRTAIAAMASEERAELSAKFCERVRHSLQWTAARAVLLYLPLADEPDIRPLAEAAWRTGKTVAIPHIIDAAQRQMAPAIMSSLEAGHFRPGPHGLLQPSQYNPLPLDRIDLCLVPGLGFTPAGDRLGRGGGYYDRFLPQLGPATVTIGVCFEAQVVDALPRDPLDRRVGWIATEHGLRRAFAP